MTADARDHTEALAEALWDALDQAHDNAYHVHAAECCWSFPGVMDRLRYHLAAAERRGRAAGFKSGVRAGYRAAQEAEGHPAPHLTKPGITGTELMSRVDRGIERIKREREDAERRGRVAALREAARYFEYDMAPAWGGDAHWLSTGNRVADLIGEVLRELAADVEDAAELDDASERADREEAADE